MPLCQYVCVCALIGRDLYKCVHIRNARVAFTINKTKTTQVPKPLMEKRRRDRINQSLETLRLLLLENTHNEKLKNPKVEKAEILESVVNFLRAEQRSDTDSYPITRGKRGRAEDYDDDDDDVSSPCKRQSYRDGMRTCLLRVSHFIASKSHEFGQGAEKAHANLHHKALEHSLQTQLLSPTPPQRETQVHLYEDSLLLAQQHHVQLNNSCVPSACSKLAQRTGLSIDNISSSPKQPVLLCDNVWRPWPQ
ncbi:hairy-related 5 [Misgurnus anguillicaudatus]|uniref:hairy-related 5 n=1 Tax=Misgurnus anguillicaudatus TaxID=75329 RepID=UPI003CCF9842